VAECASEAKEGAWIIMRAGHGHGPRLPMCSPVVANGQVPTGWNTGLFLGASGGAPTGKPRPTLAALLQQESGDGVESRHKLVPLGRGSTCRSVRPTRSYCPGDPRGVANVVQEGRQPAAGPSVAGKSELDDET
jgi:hypothetical protein